MNGNGTAVPCYVCPLCHGALRSTIDAFSCFACARDYPIVMGIPDFRVSPDPWIGIEDDRAKALRLEEASAGQGLEAMVREYWAMTPATPAALAHRFTERVLTAVPRSREWLATLDLMESTETETWLDIGCGTAALAAAAPASAHMVGIDVAFRWLVVARRRLVEQGRTPHLVCCNAEHLPFSDCTFSRVLSVGTLEHANDAQAVLGEAHRVLSPDGTAFMRTVNRYTCLPEPHVGVWGVGYLPRRRADTYVRWRSGQRYTHHCPLSAWELTRGLHRAGFRRARVWPARPLPAERATLPQAIRSALGLYEWSSRTPVASWCLRWLAPLLELRAEA